MALPLIPIISIVAGILILIAPRVLNYVVAIYLIVIGMVGLARFFDPILPDVGPLIPRSWTGRPGQWFTTQSGIGI